MHTGEGDIGRLGDIVTWDGRNRTHAYPGSCGALTGSADGLLAPGKLLTGDKFDIWSTDTCRCYQAQDQDIKNFYFLGN